MGPYRNGNARCRATQRDTPAPAAAYRPSTRAKRKSANRLTVQGKNTERIGSRRNVKRFRGGLVKGP